MMILIMIMISMIMHIILLSIIIIIIIIIMIIITIMIIIIIILIFIFILMIMVLITIIIVSSTTEGRRGDGLLPELVRPAVARAQVRDRHLYIIIRQSIFTASDSNQVYCILRNWCIWMSLGCGQATARGVLPVAPPPGLHTHIY